MGKRLFKERLCHPITDSKELNRRYSQVDFFRQKESSGSDETNEESSKQKTTGPISEQMASLSDLVETLEDPEIELEQALVLYEQGINLCNSIQETLEVAEQRVLQVTADGALSESGEPLTEE